MHQQASREHRATWEMIRKERRDVGHLEACAQATPGSSPLGSGIGWNATEAPGCGASARKAEQIVRAEPEDHRILGRDHGADAVLETNQRDYRRHPPSTEAMASALHGLDLDREFEHLTRLRRVLATRCCWRDRRRAGA